MSLLITLWVAALTMVECLARAWRSVPKKRRFSLKKWLAPCNDLPRVVLVQKSVEYPELTEAAAAFLVDRLIGLALRTGGPLNAAELLALRIDELREWSRLRRLPRMLNLGREAGVVTIAGIQEIASLAETCGDNNAEVLLSRSEIKLVHKLGGGDTAEPVDDLLKSRIAQLGLERDKAQSALERAKAQQAPVLDIAP